MDSPRQVEPEPTVAVKPSKRTCEGPFRIYGLSAKEIDAVMKYADGKTIKQIAEDTGVTVNTVGYYIKCAYTKMNVHLLDGMDVTDNNS